ncbi:IclR family transcriptional regulator YiaJ, partial [Escherichia coli]|nr:IclR family transcriptional regulator YiaJ [Escherichia coli]
MGKEVMGKKENEMAQEKERPAGSQSLFRGLMLIEILSNYPNGCPLAHLSELAGLNKSTVHRLLQGLQSCGYVTTAPAAGSYRLTTKFIAVGQKALSSLNIIHIAAPHLEALNIATGETINFSSREDDHAILIYKLEPTTGMLRTRAYIGQHMPLYCSAMGKIYMAFGHPDYVKSYWENHQHEIQPLTRNTITELPAMFDELAHIRESGAAMDREENELGVSCIAVPVFDIHGRVPYAVSISLSTSRLKQVGEKNL